MRTQSSPDAELELVHQQARSVEYRDLGGLAYSFKGLLDRIAALLLLVLLAIPIVIIAAAVKLSSPGPAFLRQVRVGRFGRPFTAYKFRSMRPDAELMRDELEDQNRHDVPTIFEMRLDPRVTAVGRFLRRTSLDELPQLFNVLRGEMSLVGPRPPLPREVVHYQPHDLQRLAATPGMTGLWQVRGRSEIEFEEMVDIDLEYIDNWSLWLDLTILVRTPIAVVGGRGAW
jgi:lipopolysaccharide/colanic/teichoic acid biosynthesis glycosyltransferase